LGAAANASGALLIAASKLRQALSEPRGVELRDGKRTDATLMAAGPAEEPRAALAHRLSHGSIYNLDQLGIACHAVDCNFSKMLT
jgi:hypothetical protein